MLNINGQFASPFASPFAANPFALPIKPPKEVPKPAESRLSRFVNYAADLSGCAFWRILWPEMVINSSGIGMSQTTTAMVPDPKWYGNVASVKLQRQATTDQKNFVRHLKDIQRNQNFKLIYEVDDVVFREDIPDYNRYKFAFDNDVIRQNCIDIINMVDEVTVTCQFMKDLYQEKTGHPNITVIPNFVPYFWMGHLYNQSHVQRTYETHKRKPRILYTGSGAHYDVDNKTGGKDDMSDVVGVIRDTVDKYQWIFVGAFPPSLEDLVRSGKIEFHPWQQLISYPTFIRNLNAQLMVAPLERNNFNRAKSDIKFIEACTLGLPCLCQDMETYAIAPPDLRFKDADEFREKIDYILNWKNRKNYFSNIPKLRAVASERFLENPENIGCHVEALTTPAGSSERKYLNKWNR